MSKGRFFLCVLLLIFSFLMFCGCKNENLSLEETFQNELNYIVSSKFDWTPGISVSIYAPDRDIEWMGKAGVSELENHSDLYINQPFRIASVSKTFVAAAIMRLHEDKELDIDDAISNYISEEHQILLINKNYKPDEITIRHCLNHTSGLFDYIIGDYNQPTPFLRIITEQPKKKWTRTEMIECAMKWGEPYALPGEEYHYGDTGYILLGEIIEKITQQQLGDALEDLLNYEKIGLSSTWLESAQKSKNSIPLISCYYRRENCDHIDASTDNFGGGGLISTVSDLSKFYYALFNDQVFKLSSTLDLMLEQPRFNANNPPSEDYRQGLEVDKVFEQQLYGHGGFWDTYAFYSPKNKAAIVVHFTDGGNDYIVKKIISILNKEQIK